MLRLPELQRAFFRAITASDLVAGSAATNEVFAEIQGDDRLTASGRVGVYGAMYVARLTDVMAEDYPRVAALVGEEQFAALAREYVTAHPSTHPSLRWFGREFASSLARATAGDLPPFAADLARLEWARLSVFDAMDAESLELGTLRDIPPDGWAELRFHLIPAVETLQVEWPVHRIWDALQPGASISTSEWRADATRLRVWRQGATVYQASMDHIEQAAFTHVEHGHDFSTLCAGLAAIVSPQKAPETAASLIVRWIADGVLLDRVTDPRDAH